MSNQKLVNGILLDLTPEEIAQRELDAQAAQTAQRQQQRQAILTQLEDVDRRSIRALREGNTARLAELEAQAAALRAQL